MYCVVSSICSKCLSRIPKSPNSLQYLLYHNARDHSDLAISMDANLLKECPVKPRLRVSNYTGEGHHNNKLNTRRRLNEALLTRIRTALFGSVVVVTPKLVITLHRVLLTILLSALLSVLAVGLVLA